MTAPAATKPVKRRNLADVVFDGLVSSIKSGAYDENERLPTEQDLALEFQVSRPTIREALQRLRDQGLIYSRRGAGSFVRNAGLRQPLGFGQVESISDLSHCYEFRITLEPEAAAAAAERHDDEGLAAIRNALDLMRDATDRERHREDADYAFHTAIAHAGKNPYFGTAMEALKDHIAVGMRFHGQSLRSAPHGLLTVYHEHKSIYEAIRGRDSALASDLMRRHLVDSRDRLFVGRRD